MSPASTSTPPGDAALTIAAHLEAHPHTGVSLFDELDNRSWPGETRAAMDTLGRSTLRIRRYAFEPHSSLTWRTRCWNDLCPSAPTAGLSIRCQKLEILADLARQAVVDLAPGCG